MSTETPKIVQIASCSGEIYCLTSAGEIFRRVGNEGWLRLPLPNEAPYQQQDRTHFQFGEDR
jgi:hypothetical protein